jgi:hypothetical protein
VLRWNDGTTEVINGTYVTEGTFPPGSMQVVARFVVNNNNTTAAGAGWLSLVVTTPFPLPLHFPPPLHSPPSVRRWAMNPLPQGPDESFLPPCKNGSLTPPVRAPAAVGRYGTNPGYCAGSW